MDELLVERAAGVVTATIHRPHVRNALDGLALDCGASWLLPRSLRGREGAGAGPPRRLVDGAEVHRIGFVNRVVPAAELAGEARAWADRLLSLAPLALGTIKGSVDRAPTTTLADALESEATDQATCVASPEVQAVFGRRSG